MRCAVQFMSRRIIPSHVVVYWCKSGEYDLIGLSTSLPVRTFLDRSLGLFFELRSLDPHSNLAARRQASVIASLLRFWARLEGAIKTRLNASMCRLTLEFTAVVCSRHVSTADRGVTSARKPASPQDQRCLPKKGP